MIFLIFSYDYLYRVIPSVIQFSSEVPEAPGSCSYALYIIEMRCTMMGICGCAIRRCKTVRIEYVIILCNIKFKPAICTSNTMHLSVLCPTTPSQAMSGKKWGFVLHKIQMHHLLGMPWPVSQIPTIPPPKTWRFMRGFVC